MKRNNRDFWKVDRARASTDDPIVAFDEKPVDPHFERRADELLGDHQPMDLDEVVGCGNMLMRDVIEQSAEFRLRSRAEVEPCEFDAYGLFVAFHQILAGYKVVFIATELSTDVLDATVCWDPESTLGHLILVTGHNGCLRIHYDGSVFADCEDLGAAVRTFEKMAVEKCGGSLKSKKDGYWEHMVGAEPPKGAVFSSPQLENKFHGNVWCDAELLFRTINGIDYSESGVYETETHECYRLNLIKGMKMPGMLVIAEEKNGPNYHALFQGNVVVSEMAPWEAFAKELAKAVVEVCRRDEDEKMSFMKELVYDYFKCYPTRHWRVIDPEESAVEEGEDAIEVEIEDVGTFKLAYEGINSFNLQWADEHHSLGHDWAHLRSCLRDEIRRRRGE